MLSINVLVGLMSVIAHHSTLITSRSPRLDCSLALQTQWEHSCTHAAQAPKLFLLPLLDLTSAPSPSCFWGFTVKMCQTQSNNTSEGKEMLWHSPASSFPLCCTGTVEGWHQDINGEVLGGRCGCPQGGKGTNWEPVNSRLHQWHCLEKQLLLQKNKF